MLSAADGYAPCSADRDTAALEFQFQSDSRSGAEPRVEAVVREELRADVPEAAQSIVEAVDRYPRDGADENRLTELFATLLRSDHEMVAWLTEKAWGNSELAREWIAGGYHVTTQATISVTSRPDLEIRFLGITQPPGNGRLFCEHKLNAAETAPQRLGYPDLRDADRLIGIKSAVGPRLTGISTVATWNDVARAIDTLARAESLRLGINGRRWRRHVDDPRTTSRELRRYEFLEYLRRKDPAVRTNDPLSTLDVATFARARSSLYTVRDLFGLIVASHQLDGLRTNEGIVSRRSFGPDAAAYEVKEAKDSWSIALRENWPALVDYAGTYWVELTIAAYDDWTPQPVGEPAIGIGYSFDLREGSWPADIAPGSAGSERLASQEITTKVGAEGWIGRCFKTLYLGEAPSRGLSLTDQAEWIAVWVRDALRSIESHRLNHGAS